MSLLKKLRGLCLELSIQLEMHASECRSELKLVHKHETVLILESIDHDDYLSKMYKQAINYIENDFKNTFL